LRPLVRSRCLNIPKIFALKTR